MLAKKEVKGEGRSMVDTPMHIMDIKNSGLNINQTKISDTGSKVCIKYFNYGWYP